MRTNVEILKIVLKGVKEELSYFKRFKYVGLCKISEILRDRKELTSVERERFIDLIHAHKPKYEALFWWPSGKKLPRVLFLKKLIKIYSNS